MPISRSIAGVVVGSIVIFFLVGMADVFGGLTFGGTPDPETGDPDADVIGMSVWNVVWYFPIALLGGWLAALIAGRKAMLHAGIIAGLIVAGGIAYVFAAPGMYEKFGVEFPGWYTPLLPISGALGALLGGRLEARRSAGKAPRSAAPISS